MCRLTSMNTGETKEEFSEVHLLHEITQKLLPRNFFLFMFLCIMFLFSFIFSRGMRFENVQILTDAISDIITDMKWAW